MGVWNLSADYALEHGILLTILCPNRSQNRVSPLPAKKVAPGLAETLDRRNESRGVEAWGYGLKLPAKHAKNAKFLKEARLTN
jgi:hypothetical protein